MTELTHFYWLEIFFYLQSHYNNDNHNNKIKKGEKKRKAKKKKYSADLQDLRYKINYTTYNTMENDLFTRPMPYVLVRFKNNCQDINI